MDRWLNLGITLLLDELRNIKGERKKAKRDEMKARMKPVMLKIIKYAREVYAGDPDFE